MIVGKIIRIVEVGFKPFDLVIMDMTIPGGMGGAEAIKKLQEIDPKVKAIVSSGYSNKDLPEGFAFALPKPYSRDSMQELINQLCR